MNIADLPNPPELACANCGDSIERGYVTVADESGEPSLATDAAICDVCGWRDVGATGCAPTLSDFSSGVALVRVEPEDGTLVPVEITDQA